MPGFLLLAGETVLRLAGFGYPTAFFQTAPGGKYVENQKFGWRFFPRTLARAPEPTVLTRTKAPGTYRIFIFGESAAQGDPVPAYSFGRILAVLLNERFPETTFEVVNVAMTAINSHVIRSIARDCADFNGDLWLIYMGNNEVIGPFGPGTAFGNGTPNRSRIRASLAAKSTRLGQGIDLLQQRFRSDANAPREWTGLEMMLERQIANDAPELQRVYESFEANLNSILKTAADAGARIVLSTVAVNLADCPPFGSGTTEKDANAFYALGQSLAQTSRREEALNAFRRARDLDTQRFRADSRINELIRSTARHRAVTLLDAESLLSTNEIPGKDLFVDHVHFTFAGNYRLARAFAVEVFPLLPDSITSSKSARTVFASQEECANRLAFTKLDEISVLDEMLGRYARPPFSNAANRDERVTEFTGRVRELRGALKAEGLEPALATYREALMKAPAADWILRERFSGVLETADRFAEAATHLEEVIEIVPQHAAAYFKLGNVYDRMGQPAKAEQSFRAALSLRPDSAEAMNGLALALATQGNTDAAALEFQRALIARPKMAAAHVNWGSMLARSKKYREAEEHFRKALEMDRTNAAAIQALAQCLVSQDRPADALKALADGTSVVTNNAALHLQYGNALARAGHEAEALREYRAAAAMDEDSFEAQMNLGVALAKRGESIEAGQAFAQAVRVQPDSPEAHLYYGVTLAQQGKLDEAIRAFEITLKLEPANARARQYLDTALSARARATP